MPATTPTSPKQPRGELAFALALTAAFAATLAFTTASHEMWRDEVNAWLFARDSRTPLELLRNTRYEGHPLLWFLLLWPLARASDDPECAKWLCALVSTAAAFVIVRHAPAPRWMRALAIFGYFPLYEYGAIARPYCLGVLGLAVCCALYQRRREEPLWLGAALALTFNSSTVALIVAAGVLVALGVEAMVRPPERTRRGALYGGLAVAVLGLVFALASCIPPADHGYSVGWRLYPDGRAAMAVLRAAMRAYLALPSPTVDFWQSDWLAALPGYYHFGGLLSVPLICLAALALARRPLALLHFALATFGLVAFFYLKFAGYLRHHGFFFLALASAFWVAALLEPVELSGNAARLARFAERWTKAAAPWVLALQVLGAAIACVSDRALVFSAAKATATLLRERGLDRLPMVADKDYNAPAVLGYLRKDKVRYAFGDRKGSFIVWDAARNRHSDVWDVAVRVRDTERSAVVVLLDAEAARERPPPAALVPSLEQLGCLVGHPEGFCLSMLKAPR